MRTALVEGTALVARERSAEGTTNNYYRLANRIRRPH